MLYKKILESEAINSCYFFTQEGKLIRIKSDLEKAYIADIEKKELESSDEMSVSRQTRLRKFVLMMTNDCNLRCKYCYMEFGKKSQGNISQIMNIEKLSGHK